MKRKPCSLPWTHLYYGTDKNVYPCCILAYDANNVVGRSDQSKEELWNSTKMREIRLKMIAGETPAECESCYVQDINNRHTSPSISVDVQNYAEKKQRETSKTGHVSVDHVYWLFTESNKCNYKCVYCSDSCSSCHSGAIRKALPEDYNTVYNIESNVLEIWFTGGEPTISVETYKMLENLISRKKTDVMIRVITNLSTVNYNGKDFYKLLSNFKDVKVFGSWDSDRKINESIRCNSNNNTIRKNIKHIRQYTNIDFYIICTVTIMNIDHIFSFHKNIVEQGLIDGGNFRYHVLTDPPHLRCTSLPDSKKSLVIDDLKKYMVWVEPFKNTYANNRPLKESISMLINGLETGKHCLMEFSNVNNVENYTEYLLWKSKQI